MCPGDAAFSHAGPSHHHDGIAILFNSLDLRALDNAEPFGQHPRAHDGNRVRIILWQDRQRFQHRHFTAEPPVCLSQFKSDRPAADDDQVAGRFRQVEYGFVGKIRHGVKARNWRNERT